MKSSLGIVCGYDGYPIGDLVLEADDAGRFTLYLMTDEDNGIIAGSGRFDKFILKEKLQLIYQHLENKE